MNQLDELPPPQKLYNVENKNKAASTAHRAETLCINHTNKLFFF